MDIEIENHSEESVENTASAKRSSRGLAQWWKTGMAVLEHWFARAVAWTATRAWQVTADWRAVRPVISRASAHLAILTVAVAAIVLSGLNLPARESLAISSEPGAMEVSAAPQDSPKALMVENGANGGLVQVSTNAHRMENSATIVRLAQPHTEIPDRPRLGVITYSVQPGDTVQSIAKSFNLQATTLLWSNPKLEELPDLLRIGQEVTILPVEGVYHTVAADDTLESIAEKYKVDVDAITELSFNSLHPPLFRIQEGIKLIIPGGTKPYVPRRVTSYTGPVPSGARGTGAFAWPVLGSITQWYWWGHRAIDIGAPTGSAVVAADGGYVSFVGWTDIGYGYLIIMDHANGYSTYYAHLSQMYVMVGQELERGQVIGAVGSTGNSTGPHLHLEIRYNGVEQNPLVYLP